MTTSIDPGSVPVSWSSCSTALTERSLACSSAAAMCLPRSPNFSTITCSGMPDSGRDLGSGQPPLRQVRSGRGETDESHVGFASRMAPDDPLEFLPHAWRQRAVAPEDPAHPDHLAEPHQGVRGDLGVELADLAVLHRLAERGDVARREPVVVEAEHLRRDELRLPDDPVERRMLGREPEVRVEAEQLRLDTGRAAGRPSFIACRTRRFRSRTSSSKIAFFESK